MALDGDEEADGRHRDHDAGRHDHAPVDDRRVEEVVDADRQRLELVRADEDEREELADLL